MIFHSISTVADCMPVGVAALIWIAAIGFCIFAIVNIVLSLIWVINQLKNLFRLL